jgi:site-specific recombinase XerD
MNFDEYLKRKEYTNKTIASFEGTVKRFLQWLEKESTEPENTSYADMLDEAMPKKRDQPAQHPAQFGSHQTLF